MNNLNILFLLRLWPVYGGGETVTICLANEMVKRGHKVSVAYFKDNVKEQMPFIDDRINAIRIDGVDCDELYMDGTASKQTCALACKSVVEIVRNRGIDTVIDQWWPPEFISTLKSECPDVKIIKCHHSADLSIDNIKRILPCVDRYVFPSLVAQRKYETMAHYDNHDGKLDSIPNPNLYTSEQCIFPHDADIVLPIEKIADRWERLISHIGINTGSSLPAYSCCELEDKTISVVIPSYGRAHLIEQTIPSFLQEGVSELIVVDDCSQDNTTEVIANMQKKYPQIKYFRNPQNMRQPASNNRGIEQVHGDYIYFGDDDSILTPGSIRALKQTLEYYDVGAVMARPLYAGSNYKPRFHDKYMRWITARGKVTSSAEIYDVSSLTGNWRGYLPYPIEVPYMHACALVRTELARQCMFDTNYQGCAYREETDFFFRLSLDFGAKLMYDARAVQFNLPDYMVRSTGARTGGYETWKRSAIECNNYFLDKNWDNIAAHYGLTVTKDEIRQSFEQSLRPPHTNPLKKVLKDIYFFLLYHTPFIQN